MLGPFGLGYFLSYLFRAVNAVVGPELVTELGLSAGQLGLLTSSYLLAFALFQLPLGVLLDRFGPRRVQGALLCVAALGSLLFGLGQNALALALARGLIGLGFAGGLMSGFKAVVLWVPAPRRALANACVMAFGGLGLLVATVPVEAAMAAFGWRGMFHGLALTTFLLAGLLLLLVPEPPPAATPQRLSQQLASIGQIYRDRVFWRLAPLIASTAGSHIAIQTLWAGPWFRDVMALPKDAVAWHLMVVAAAFFIGILVSGAVADWFVRRGVDLLTVMLGFLAIYLAAEVAIVLQWPVLQLPIWFLFGMTGQVAILAYPWLSAHFGAALSGRSNTAMNLLMFGTAFGVQSLIGAIIDRFPPTLDGGYDPFAYQIGFGVCLTIQLLALLWFLPARPAMLATRPTS